MALLHFMDTTLFCQPCSLSLNHEMDLSHDYNVLLLLFCNTAHGLCFPGEYLYFQPYISSTVQLYTRLCFEMLVMLQR